MKDTLKTMENKQVQRIPIVNDGELLIGMISMNDIVVHAEEAMTMRELSYSYADLVQTMEGICSHRQPVA